MDAKTVKAETNILVVMAGSVTLKRIANTEGGEWCGPCPFCGGEDRFRVQPHHNKGGRWYCRGCGDESWHDVFDFIQRRDGIEFKEALNLLSGGNYNQQQKKKKLQLQQLI